MVNEFPIRLNNHIDEVLNAPSTSDDKAKRLIESALISQSENIPEPVPTISIIQNGIRSVLCSEGNFMTLTGKAKSRKTFFTICMIAALISGRSIFEVVSGCLPEHKRVVLVFDTEQSRFHTQRLQKRILRLAEQSENRYLKVFNLRPLTHADRLAAVEYAIYNTPGVGAVFIDGVRDFAVNPITDPEQSDLIIGKLLKWTDDLKISIICVLHQNKGDSNVRGHLGTEIVNKGESTICVTKSDTDRQTSTITAEYCRDREFEPISFRINDEGIPEMADATIEKKPRKPKATGPSDFNEIQHKSILDEVFEYQSEYSYQELWEKIIGVALTKHKVSLGDNKAKEFVTWYKEKEWIRKVGKDNSKNSKYVMGSFLPTNGIKLDESKPDDEV